MLIQLSSRLKFLTAPDSPNTPHTIPHTIHRLVLKYHAFRSPTLHHRASCLHSLLAILVVLSSRNLVICKFSGVMVRASRNPINMPCLHALATCQKNGRRIERYRRCAVINQSDTALYEPVGTMPRSKNALPWPCVQCGRRPGVHSGTCSMQCSLRPLRLCSSPLIAMEGSACIRRLSLELELLSRGPKLALPPLLRLCWTTTIRDPVATVEHPHLVLCLDTTAKEQLVGLLGSSGRRSPNRMGLQSDSCATDIACKISRPKDSPPI